MINKIICSFFFILFFFFTGCKKYDEGPDFTLRSVTDRLCGDWIVESLTVEGADSLPVFLNHEGSRDYYSFEKDEKESGSMNGINNDYSDLLPGGWRLHYDCTYVSFGNAKPYGPVFNGYVNWKILKLTNKEMWFETTYINYKKYEIHFKAK